MTKMKKMIALAIALVMVICTMNVGIFAATGDLSADTTITITELDAGDTVNLYKVLEWVDSEGWRLTSDFDVAAIQGLDTIKALIDPQKGQPVVEMTKHDLEEIAKVAKTVQPVNSDSNVVAAGETSYTYTTFDDKADPVVDRPGMYVALVEPAVAGVVYNPILISADYESKNSTNSISSSAMMGTSEDIAAHAVAKKKKVSGEKTETKITNDIGDVYDFKIETTIPVFAGSYIDTYFTLTDTVGEYLKLVDGSLEIKDLDGNTVTPTTNTFAGGAQEFTLSWDDAYIKALPMAQDIVITYQAELAITKEEAAELPNVQEEHNRIIIEFPNNPKDDNGKGAIKDETREYTFTIDGKLWGDSDWQTAEIVKVGLDNDGNPVESMVNYDNGSEHAALNGAKFGLYTNEDDAKAGNENYYTNDAFDGTVETADGGLLHIPGLDVGTYYLKELTSPKGYIKDDDVHTIVIDAVFEETDVTEYWNGTAWNASKQSDDDVEFTYTVTTLKSYTVTVDGNESKYEMTLSGPSISSVTPGDSSTEIVNTKGVELPATGGMGTTIFYVIGTILVLGAGILLVTRRRMNMN